MITIASVLTASGSGERQGVFGVFHYLGGRRAGGGVGVVPGYLGK